MSSSDQSDFRERVIDEKAALDVKIGKLAAFLTLHGHEVAALERELLVEQRRAMESYSHVLGQRIRGWR